MATRTRPPRERSPKATPALFGAKRSSRRATARPRRDRRFLETSRAPARGRKGSGGSVRAGAGRWSTTRARTSCPQSGRTQLPLRAAIGRSSCGPLRQSADRPAHQHHPGHSPKELYYKPSPARPWHLLVPDLGEFAGLRALGDEPRSRPPGRVVGQCPRPERGLTHWIRSHLAMACAHNCGVARRAPTTPLGNGEPPFWRRASSAAGVILLRILPVVAPIMFLYGMIAEAHALPERVDWIFYSTAQS